MKKSNKVILGALFMMAAQACNNQPKKTDWITGYGSDGKAKDTVVGGRTYRYYNNGYYPVMHGFICPGYYRRGYSFGEISSPGFIPEAASGSFEGGTAKGVSTGGFGRSAGVSAGE